DLGVCRHRVGATPDPLDRLFLRLDLPQPVAGDELLRLGEWAVDHRALAAREPHACALAARMQPFAREQDAGFGKLLVVFAHRLQQFPARHLAGLGILRRLDHDHESHGYLLEKLAYTPSRTARRQIDTSVSGFLQRREPTLEEAPLGLLPG